MTDMNKMLEKVRKLLALASNNPSEEEAKAAALKAQELITQYNLDLDKDTPEEVVEYRMVPAVHSNNEGFRKPLAAVIAENFRCKAIIARGRVVFFGRAGDVEACAETFNYLYKVCHNIGERLERKARKEGRSTRGVANSYYYGFILGINDSMSEQSKALAIVVPDDVEEEYSKRFVNIRKDNRGMRDMGFDPEAYQQGLDDGRNSLRRKRIEK